MQTGVRRQRAESRVFWLGVWVMALLWPTIGAAQSSAGSGTHTTPYVLPEVTVVDTTPLHSDGIDRDKVPAFVQTLKGQDFERTHSFAVTDAFEQRISGITLTDVQGNSFFQDLRYRGFAASPLQGTPQGLAVYQNGIRLNEAFGDTVNWDLIPEVAIERADIWTNNPAFGLNALGGAVSVQMKNGFTWQGFEGEMQGGMYGRYGGSLQYGVQKDTLGFYLAADGVHDDGWRLHSPASLARIYGDLGWRQDRFELHLIGSGVTNRFGVVGPTPIEMVRQRFNSIYTWPQRTTNEMGLLALTGTYGLSDTWSVQSNLYLRRFKQRHVDGNDGEFARCGEDSSDPTALCLDDEEFVPPADPPPASWRDQLIIRDPHGRPIPFTSEDVPYGTVDRTWTDGWTYGGSLQATTTSTLFGHGNYGVVGASIDHGTVDFHSNSRLGNIFPSLFVGPDADVAGTGTVIHNIPDPTVDPEFSVLFEPVKLRARNTYYGLYAADTFDITSKLSFTAGARFNIADIAMRDKSGLNATLKGHHHFERINPQAGLTYTLAPGITAYVGYSEANRAPTPLELNCANPNQPCLLENALVSDPPLKQVVAHTYEGGLRGQHRAGEGQLEWKVGVFRTDSDNDIISLASVIPGRGYFTNVPSTRRQGLEASLQYQAARWLFFTHYSYTDATYRFSGTLASPNNPSADEDGNILVRSGKRLPRIPQHQLQFGLDYKLTPAWTIGGDIRGVSRQYFVGDDANQNTPLPAYWVTGLHTSYQMNAHLQLFALVNNLFDRHYATYGTYFQADSIAFKNFQDARTITPAQPLSAYGGLRMLW